MSLPGRFPLGGRDLNPPCGSKSSETFHERRTVMMSLALIVAMYHGAIFIFFMIAVIGISTEMVLRR